MPVAVECEPGSGGPLVPYCPHPRPTAQLVETVPGVHEEHTDWVRLWWHVHLLIRETPRGVPARLSEGALVRIRPCWRRLDGRSGHALSYCVDGALDPGRKAGTEVEVACRCRGLVADHFQETLGHQAAVDLADADWPHARVLVQSNQSTCHEPPVGGPRRRIVGQPFSDAS